MATKVVATATVRALKGRKLIPTRAALTLVSFSFGCKRNQTSFCFYKKDVITKKFSLVVK